MAQKLSIEFYNLKHPWASKEEIDFFIQRIEEAEPGVWLEPMCGSGRLLIPLLLKGYSLEGLDNSPSMLESCRRRLREYFLSTTLYEQDIENLNCSKKYRGILIPFGSFQFLRRASIEQTLNLLSKHLLPGGRILITLSISRNRSFCKERVTGTDGSVISVETTLVDHHKHSETAQRIYTKLNQAGMVVGTEQETLHISWYEHEEFMNLLKKTGFDSITATDHGNGMATYEATTCSIRSSPQTEILSSSI